MMLWNHTLGNVEGIYAGANDAICLTLKEGGKGGVRGTLCASSPPPARHKELLQPQSKLDLSSTGKSP